MPLRQRRDDDFRQRLVRRLCVECREPYEVPEEVRARFALLAGPRHIVYRAKGCPACGATGYAGRTSILELFEPTPSVQRLILKRADARALEEAAVSEGMRTMFRHGVEKVVAGETTLEEVLRVTRAT